MKIAFVVCPEYTSTMPHLGIAYMRSVLEQSGHKTLYFDFSAKKRLDSFFINAINGWINLFSKQTLMNTFYTFLPSVINYFNKDIKLNVLQKSLHSYIKEEAKKMANEVMIEEPDYVCFSIYNTTLFFSLVVAYEIKQIKSDTKIIFGGPFLNEERLRELLEKFNFIIDYVVIGEGEEVIKEIIEERSGKGFVKEARPIEELDKLPFPIFEGCDFNLYNKVMNGSKTWRGLSVINEKIIPVIATRGCPFQCAFCDHHVVWKNYRKRSVNNVIEEIIIQNKKYDCKVFRLNDSLINSDIEWLKEFCFKIIENKLHIYWYAHCRADKFNKEIADLMYRSGCRYLKFGIESGSQRVLNLMNKRIKIEKMKEAINAAYEAGIKVRTSFIYAYPGEQREELSETIKFIEEIMDKLYGLRIYSFIFMPGTPLELKAEENNIKLINFNVNNGEFKQMLSNLPEVWTHTKINEEEIKYRSKIIKQLVKRFSNRNDNYIPYMFSDIYKLKFNKDKVINYVSINIKDIEEDEEWVKLIINNGVRIKLKKRFYNFIRENKEDTIERYVQELKKEQDIKYDKAMELIIALMSCGVLMIREMKK